MTRNGENAGMRNARLTMIDLDSALTIRPAHAGDERALRRLAALDSAEGVPTEPLLVAEVESGLRAALSLSDGTVIADPFAPTADVVSLLRERARMIERRRTGPAGWRPWLRGATARVA
jgi:hypothetical protein